ncbi:MAG: hypothetical protein DMD28_05360 [Gemmatimonadetes bacterium]|nr:MAG: hypothetical protein DMD28_05360 [Gemmatimonadota bacterium]
MMRLVSLLGFATLLLAACHGSGTGGTTMDPMDPMMYRAPALHAQANGAATSDRINSCTSATGIQSAASRCSPTR